MNHNTHIARNFLLVKIILSLMIVNIYYCSALGQNKIPLNLEYHIKRSVIKNITLGQIYSHKRYFSRNEVLFNGGYNSPLGADLFINFPGFGYLPDELEILVTSIETSFPDSLWKFYEVSFPDTDSLKNDSLIAWSKNSLAVLSKKKNLLIGMNEKSEVKYISGGFGFRHSIKKYFNLDKETPESYLPFLTLKLYSYKHDDIEFSRREGEKLVFIASKKTEDGGFQAVKEYFIDPQNPEKIQSKRIEAPEYKTHNRRPRPKLKFESTEDKKRYLLNALMKNIYLYRILHLPDLESRLNFDTSQWLIKDGDSDLESLIPAYDEYWNRIEMVSFDLKYSSKHCKEAWKPFQKIFFDDPPNYNSIVYNKIFENIEFYRFYKDTVETFASRSGKFKPSGGCCTYDYYYHPEEKKKYDEWIEKNDFSPPPPPPPLEPMPDIYRFGGDPKCLPYNLPFSEKWQRRMDYYLMALDTKTREVYFISGKNIYLTKAAHLYPPVNKELPASIKDWANPYKLEYIKDRFYSYQVPIVAEENIVAQDDEKLVLEVIGSEYGKEVKLKVTFYNEKPELLEIENLTK